MIRLKAFVQKWLHLWKVAVFATGVLLFLFLYRPHTSVTVPGIGTYGWSVVGLIVLTCLLGVLMWRLGPSVRRLFSTRTPPPTPGTPPTPPPVPPAPPTRSAWGTRMLLGIAGVAVVGALTYLFLLYGEEVRKMVPDLPEMPDVPLPQSRGEILQWIEGIEWRWGSFGWMLPYLTVPFAGTVSHHFSANTATGYRVWKVTLQTMLYTFLAVLAMDFRDVFVALFDMVGVSVQEVLRALVMSFGMDAPTLVTILGTFVLMGVVFLKTSHATVLLSSVFLTVCSLSLALRDPYVPENDLTGMVLLVAGVILVVVVLLMTIVAKQSMFQAGGVAVAYTLIISQLMSEQYIYPVDALQVIAVLAMIGCVLAGYVRRASVLGLSTAVLLALLHT